MTGSVVAGGKIPVPIWTVGWDLDSTLFDTSHRHYLIDEIKAGKATWDDYAMLCGNDVPIEGQVALMRAMPRYHHAAISNRVETALDLTMDSVLRHEIPLDSVHLKPVGLELDAGQFKVSVIRYMQASGHWFVLFVEDNPEIAEHIRQETGIPVLVVNPCYPEMPDTGST